MYWDDARWGSGSVAPLPRLVARKAGFGPQDFVLGFIETLFRPYEKLFIHPS